MAVIRSVGKAFLIAVPLTISAARLQSYSVGAPSEITSEVTRCLSVVRVAATRRGRRHLIPQPGRTVTTLAPAGRVDHEISRL